ncbi:hypothetical protein [uncultured Roseibium sp.]|uniref:hypothetical protein n=1 Tax=uncultured Roseibium sp. TaxID=1936171 RepID=UPI003217204E
MAGLTGVGTIVATARQIDETDLAVFSIRDLARTPGVSSGNISWHVGDAQEDFFAAISVSITMSVSRNLASGRDGQKRLRSVFRFFRDNVRDRANITHPARSPARPRGQLRPRLPRFCPGSHHLGPASRRAQPSSQLA